MDKADQFFLRALGILVTFGFFYGIFSLINHFL